MNDLLYEVDELRKDVKDIDGGQEQLSKRLDRLEAMLLHLARHVGYSPAAAGAYVVDTLTSPL